MGTERPSGPRLGWGVDGAPDTQTTDRWTRDSSFPETMGDGVQVRWTVRVEDVGGRTGGPTKERAGREGRWSTGSRYETGGSIMGLVGLV